MTISQQKLREILFELLYSYDFAQNSLDDMASFLMKHHEITKKNIYIINEKKQAIIEKLPEIDEKIAQTSKEYEFERISKVEKNILRLAIFELLWDETVPEKVAISEAIRLCRKFSTPEGASFVNAILDALFKEKN